MDRLNSSRFKNFYTEFYKQCFLFAKSYVHDDMAAEDIASEALIKLWEMTKVQEVENPRTILFVIIKNKALDYLKHETVKQNAFESLTDYSKRELEIRIATLEACYPEKIFASDIRDIIKQTLTQMPEQTRHIFEMYRFRNMSKKEIADLYGISVKGIDYHITRAISFLKKNLKDYYTLFFVF